MKFNLTIYLICLSLTVFAQDKLFFKNGNYLSTNIITIHKNQIIILDSNLSHKSINTKDLILLETKSGIIKLFNPKDSSVINKNNRLSSFGVVLSDVFLTRLTLCYERFFTKNKHLGVALPIGFNFINSNSRFMHRYMPNSSNKQAEFLWNTGLELNYYLKNNSNGLYLGPRFRYGYLFYSFPYLANSFQFQIGKRFMSTNKKFSQNISVGLGVFKFLEMFPKKYYFSSFSLNYRLALNW
ncbi:MAG: hypothetical protein LCH32_10250 [Bacteroidetes bacterium]|nr:hypothetical protein [Bacteroidota bacterium]